MQLVRGARIWACCSVVAIALNSIVRAPLRCVPCWEQLRASLRRKQLFLLGAFTARVNSCPDTCPDRGCGVEGEKIQQDLFQLAGIYSSAHVRSRGNMPGYYQTVPLKRDWGLSDRGCLAKLLQR